MPTSCSRRCSRAPAWTPIQDAERSDLWQRVRDGYALPALDGELVQKWEQWYASRPDYVQRMTERGSRYLFYIVEEVERRGMPGELALLPFIESAFNPQAVSSARASGMWQFMPATGKDFDLRQNLFRDDRRDVLASTRAALDYLQRLHTQFGDWHLALAAYNWGQGNVQRAIDRNRRAGLAADYLSLRMPDETRNYVPKLQAVMNIVARPQTFGLSLPPLENHPYFLSVLIERDIDVVLAARLVGHVAGGVPVPQPPARQAGDPGRRHTAGAAALRPRQPLPARAAAPQRPAGQLDGLGGAEDDQACRGGATGGHERGPAARGQPHPGSHAGQGGLDAAGAAPRALRHRRCRIPRAQRRHDLGARRSAAAPCHLQGRAQGRQRGGRGAPLSGERGAGGAVEHGRHRSRRSSRASRSWSCCRPSRRRVPQRPPARSRPSARRNPRRAAAPLRPRRDSRACPIPRRRGAAGRRWWWRESRNSAARSASGKPRR